MARVKRGVTTKYKHKKLLSLVKGHKGGRSKLVREAKQSALHAGAYAFAGRRQRRRDMRKLWITQVNIALDGKGVSYSKFISEMKAKNIILDRKIMAEMAVHHPSQFEELVEKVWKRD